MEPENIEVTFPIESTRLTRDLKAAAGDLTVDEARFMVDAYYQMQDMRIATGNQIFSMKESAEPHLFMVHISSQYKNLEGQIKNALDRFSANQPIGEWARGVRGIGPVLAAGLIAHIDIEKCETSGQLWRYAGLDPTSIWGKGEKRPWNAQLKTLCWKIGECFVKAGGEYGDYYKQRKLSEIEKNGNGDFTEQAVAKLEKFKIGKTTDAYKYYSGAYSGIKIPETGSWSGVKKKKGEDGIPMLPPAHIHARAKRYAVKLFLSHFHDEYYRIHFGKEPPLPYAIAHLGHAHIIEPYKRTEIK